MGGSPPPPRRRAGSRWARQGGSRGEGVGGTRTTAERQQPAAAGRRRRRRSVGWWRERLDAAWAAGVDGGVAPEGAPCDSARLFSPPRVGGGGGARTTTAGGVQSRTARHSYKSCPLYISGPNRTRAPLGGPLPAHSSAAKPTIACSFRRPPLHSRRRAPRSRLLGAGHLVLGALGTSTSGPPRRIGIQKRAGSDRL